MCYELCLGAVSVTSAVLGAAPKVPLPIALAKRILAECGAKTWLRQLLVCTAGHPAVCWGGCARRAVSLWKCLTVVPVSHAECGNSPRLLAGAGASALAGLVTVCSVCRSVCWGSAGEEKGSGKEERFCIMLKRKSHL